MSTWTLWQKVAFLGYLLALNVVIFGALAYALLSDEFWPSPAVDETMAELPAVSASVPTQPPPSSPVTATLLPTNIPSSIPKPTETSSATSLPSSTATQTPRPTRTPSPTDTATASPTSTATPPPSPTATQTSRPTAIPTPTNTATRTPRPTRTPTLTSTPTPSPTATSTPTAAPAISAASQASHITQDILPVPIAVSSAFTSKDKQSPFTNFEFLRPVSSGPSLRAVEISAIDDHSVALEWSSSGAETRYQVYSDMGRGFGVYIHKAVATQAEFVDDGLRPNNRYRYRLVSPEADSTFVETTANTSHRVMATQNYLGVPSVSTISVTPAPTALPADTVLLGLLSDNKYTDNFGVLNIVGEVRNDSNVPVGRGEIAITFYDAAGTVIGTTRGQPMIEVIAPGETSPFMIDLPRPPGLASYSLRAVAHPVTADLSPQLAVTELRRFEDETGFLHIKGQIRNSGKITAKRVKVAAILYGRDGRVINVGFTYVIPPILRPDETAAYDILFTYYPRYATQVVIPFEE